MIAGKGDAPVAAFGEPDLGGGDFGSARYQELAYLTSIPTDSSVQPPVLPVRKRAAKTRSRSSDSPCNRHDRVNAPITQPGHDRFAASCGWVGPCTLGRRGFERDAVGRQAKPRALSVVARGAFSNDRDLVRTLMQNGRASG